MDTIRMALGLGLEPKDLTILQVSLRAIVVFIVALIMVRLSAKRFLAGKTAFDAIVTFILASMLARAVNGSAAFVPTLVAGFVVIAFHRILAVAAYRSHQFGVLIKGSESVLVENGRLREEEMRKSHVTQSDVLEDIRLRAQIESLQEVKVARLERSGDVSVIKR